MSKKTDYEEKMDFWLKVCMALALFNVILFIVIMNLKADPVAVGVFCVLLFIGLITFVFSVIKCNIYNAKAKNMGFYDYIEDGFHENAQSIKKWFQNRKKKKLYPTTEKKSIEDMTINEILASGPETEDELIDYLIMADLLNEDIEKL